MLPQHLQLSSDEYLLDHIRFMRNQETTSSYRVSRDYFNDGACECVSSTRYTVTSSERKTMLSWAYDIVDVCKVERHVAITAVSYLDRFLANNIGQCAKALSSRRNYQLIFIVCLIIALKNCAGMKVESDFVTNVLCHGLYQEQEILEMEMVVLQGLGWRLNGPTAIDFVHAFLQLLPDQDNAKMEALIKTAEVQVELAMCDFSLALQEPSSIACSSIALAMNSADGKYCSGIHAVDRFVWMQSVAMAAGLDVERLMMRMVQTRLIENTSDLGTISTCSDISETSPERSSPRTSFCDINHFYGTYGLDSYEALHCDGSIGSYSYHSRKTQ